MDSNKKVTTKKAVTNSKKNKKKKSKATTKPKKNPNAQLINVSKKMTKFSKKYMWMIIVVFFLGIGAAALTIWSPTLLQNIIDEMQSWIYGKTPSMDPVLKTCITLIILYSCAWLMNYANRYIMAIFSQRVSKKMRTDVNSKIDRLPMAHFNENSTGETLSVIANDTDATGVSINNS
ncbi:MAG: ABC transporter transmembrane domain-containing protein, partial [Mycoplasma sp.]